MKRGERSKAMARIRSRVMVSSKSRRLWCDERGAMIVLVALSITVMLAFTGLAVDVGWWYTIQRQNQSGADAAAISAAYQVLNGNTNVANDLTPVATQAATLNHYAGATPVVNYPYGGNANKVEVILRQGQNTWFSSIAGLNSVTIATRAAALVDVLPVTCILATNPTASNAINVAGNATINAPGCTIVSNSNSSSAVHLQGGVNIDAATLITPGQVDYTGSAYTLDVDYPAQTGAQSVPDPYASTLTHANLINGMPTAASCSTTCTKSGSTWSGSCVLKGSDVSVGETLSANTQICGGLSFKNGTVNLMPGLYWISDGDLTLQNGTGTTLTCPTCSNGGAGVTIILTTAKTSGGTVGALTLGSNANLTLNAPNTSTAAGFNNAGMLLIQDSHNLPAGTTINSPSSTQANASETLSGLLYFPKSKLSFQGTPSASGPQCLMIVANTLDLQGNPGFDTSGCQCAAGAAAGTCLGLNTIPQPKRVALVE